MRGMLQRRYLSVLEVKSRDEFQAELVRFTRELGFDLVSAVSVIDRLLSDPEFIAVGNTPEAYRETFSDREVGRRDPVAQHCKTTSLPIVWDQSTYTQRGLGDAWDN